MLTSWSSRYCTPANYILVLYKFSYQCNECRRSCKTLWAVSTYPLKSSYLSFMIFLYIITMMNESKWLNCSFKVLLTKNLQHEPLLLRVLLKLFYLVHSAFLIIRTMLDAKDSLHMYATLIIPCWVRVHPLVTKRYHMLIWKGCIPSHHSHPFSLSII